MNKSKDQRKYTVEKDWAAILAMLDEEESDRESDSDIECSADENLSEDDREFEDADECFVEGEGEGREKDEEIPASNQTAQCFSRTDKNLSEDDRELEDADECFDDVEKGDGIKGNEQNTPASNETGQCFSITEAPISIVNRESKRFKGKQKRNDVLATSSKTATSSSPKTPQNKRTVECLNSNTPRSSLFSAYPSTSSCYSSIKTTPEACHKETKSSTVSTPDISYSPLADQSPAKVDNPTTPATICKRKLVVPSPEVQNKGKRKLGVICNGQPSPSATGKRKLTRSPTRNTCLVLNQHKPTTIRYEDIIKLKANRSKNLMSASEILDCFVITHKIEEFDRQKARDAIYSALRKIQKCRRLKTSEKSYQESDIVYRFKQCHAVTMPPRATPPQATPPRATPPRATPPRATSPLATPPRATPPLATPDLTSPPPVTPPPATPSPATPVLATPPTYRKSFNDLGESGVRYRQELIATIL